jgi:DNA-binding NarL/FixJ family response regulator
VPAVRVLIVDDHELFRRAVGELIEDVTGFVVVASVDSAQRALDLIAERPIDLVLMDINMPGLNGLDASRRIAERPGAPIVVLLSTYDASEIDPTACGAAAYVSKLSFSAEQLREVWSSVRR